jgi:hypothetical protein
MPLNQKSHSQLSEKLFIGLTTKPRLALQMLTKQHN